MKRLLPILFLLFSHSAKTQTDLASLSESLVKNSRSEKEKVTAIFRWITENIAYTTFTKQQKKNKYYVAEPDDDGPLKPLNERVAEMVLKKRTAFCDGYARLFTSLCDQAGIRSEIICGYANGGLGRQETKFGVNHYWNAVWLDGKWQLLDATWASGYISMRSGEFVKDYNGQYFLASPEAFIRDHYPDDPRWTLLPDDKMPDEFRYSPFRQKSFAKYGFTSFSPGKGIIEAAVGDTIILQLEAGREDIGSIASSLTTDSSLFSYSASWVFLKPDNAVQSPEPAPRRQYTYTVSSTAVQWLYLLYNDDVVMRYKLNVKAKQYN